MRSLQRHHIVNLYCWVDDLIEKQTTVGRKPVLTNSEIITILLWGTIVLKQKNLKSIHQFTLMYLQTEFPKMPKYSAFIDHCHRVMPVMVQLLEMICVSDAPVTLVDSTMLQVCTVARANQHKVAKRIAQYGKNRQGWHYGFKLHASVTLNGQLTSIAFTPANKYDAQMMPAILKKGITIAVGDSHYGASVMRKKIWEKYRTIIIAPPHWKQKTKLMARWQYALLRHRSKIEAVFDVLKQHFHLVSSFPRSIAGFFLHYTRILLAYQALALSA